MKDDKDKCLSVILRKTNKSSCFQWELLREETALLKKSCVKEDK